MISNSNKSCAVLFSGGQDSSCALIWALEHYNNVHAISFDYHQAHSEEIAYGKSFLMSIENFPDLCTKSHTINHHIITLDSVKKLVHSSLLDDFPVNHKDLPHSFVPGRNALFFLHACSFSYTHSIHNIIGGMCEVDYSGYPDCRKKSIMSLNDALNLNYDYNFHFHVPFIHTSKHELWKFIYNKGGDKLISLIVDSTLSCYHGNTYHECIHTWGRGCGSCPACILRMKGWKKWSSLHTG